MRLQKENRYYMKKIKRREKKNKSIERNKPSITFNVKLFLKI